MIVEVRTYRLKPGTEQEFVRLFREEALPLLDEWGITVVDFGLSIAADDDHPDAYLVRQFASLAQRREHEDAFYGSSAWRDGPREAIMASIESFHTIVLDGSDHRHAWVAPVRATEDPAVSS